METPDSMKSELAAWNNISFAADPGLDIYSGATCRVI
jgi:hypothetical protein